MNDQESPSSEPREYDVWQDVLEEALPPEDREPFRKRKLAVTLKCDGAKDDKIKLLTGFDRQVVAYFLKRCRTCHADGNPWGFRILVPGTRLSAKNQRKTKPVKPKPEDEKPPGLAGAFSWLLEAYPDIKELIINLFLARAKRGEVAEKKMLKTDIHQEMLKTLRAKGLTDNDYPFFTLDKGLRSLELFLDDLYDSHFKEIIKNQEGKQAARNLGSGKMRMEDPPGRPNAQMEIDAHKLNAMIEIEYDMGIYPGHVVTYMRPWLLALICRMTRVVWAYLLVFKAEINHLDIFRLMKRFVQPYVPTVIPVGCELKHLEGAGMPTSLIPECRHALGDEFYLDNALAHTADDSQTLFTEVLGGALITGRFRTPNDRPYVEHLFKKFERHSTLRMPSTTGIDPTDARRDNPKKAARRFRLNHEKVELLTAVTFDNYNARTHGELSRHSPLDMLRHNLLGSMPLRMFLTPNDMSDFNKTKTVPVRGGKKEKRRPYIEYMHVRYSSVNLGKTPSLAAGKKLKLSIDYDDISRIDAYLEDGNTFFDVLVPNDRKWRKPHTYEYRQQFYRNIGTEETDDGVHEFATNAGKNSGESAGDEPSTVRTCGPASTQPPSFAPLSGRHDAEDFKPKNR